MNFYHLFVPHAAEILRPLYQATTGSKTQQKTIEWSEDHSMAFETAKNAIAQATMLCHPKQGAGIALTTDAYDVALGAVLEQRTGNGYHGSLSPSSVAN